MARERVQASGLNEELGHTCNRNVRRALGAEAAWVDALQSDVLYHRVTIDRRDSRHRASIVDLVFDPAPARRVDQRRREHMRVGYDD